MANKRKESKDNRGFFLFSAINGLIERARSSAEKESQRLFTTPLPVTSVPAAKDSTQQRNSEQRKRKNTSLVESLSKAKHRPRPPRKQPEAPVPLLRKRRAVSHSLSASLPLRAGSAMSVRTRLATTVDTLALDDNASTGSNPESENAIPAPGTASKRKRSEEATLSSPPLSSAQLPQHQQQHQEPPSPQTSLDLFPKKVRLSDVSALEKESANTERIESPESSRCSPVLEAPIHAVSTRSSMTAVSAFAPMTRPTTVTFNGSEGYGTSPSSVVERARLEKVERELHRLKKIIASLLPEELNDDDLRSVYGELEQPRVSSNDFISRLIRSRMGVVRQGISPELPPSPTSNSPVRGPVQSSTGDICAPDSTIPPPPPLPPISSSLLNSAFSQGVLSVRGQNLANRQLSQSRVQPSLQQRRGSNDSASSLLPASGRPRVVSSTVRQLRAELRPIPKPSEDLPPPHKDPGVMVKLLEEMKHHKLRPVKKRPKDMCS
ncbi:hypothetical protein COEREDRAFT_7295 [Coemansia reversa NRRL 1564]|uniref:Uncharacterized protein n=1 Tax=Coemansia reversa (strain ATCC 12441 / NRRL 1564) TaxID=763665 RepID=A0A2G5BFD0_COERN|nr:hypothetical protein COEREDRAFT_7295 [Coemansia reversa NRRL 1564]|eukprot:PIA17701.1 hypothetical protein COEREDRAFT_7295 [Coemansia reversa NRRL 1564]